MRHRLDGRQFGRNSAHRKAMLRSLAMALVEHERIETTVAKAKELRRVADRLVTLGKEGRLSSRRLAQSVLQDHGLVSKLFNEIAPRVQDRQGGYTRIIKTRRRSGDGASMAMIEFIGTKPPVPRRGRTADQTEQPAAAEAGSQ